MLRRLARSTRGSTIWEFAIIFPMLMTIGFATWEFGRLTDALLIATNAAREGARYAAAHTSDSNLTSDTQIFVHGYLQVGYGTRMGPGGDISISTDQIGVTLVDQSGAPVGSPVPGGRVTVTVPIEAKVFTPFVPGLSNVANLTGVETMSLQ